jgi:hypothetical protein
MRNARLRTLALLAAILGCPGALLAQVQTFDGTLTIVWADPSPETSHC